MTARGIRRQIEALRARIAPVEPPTSVDWDALAEGDVAEWKASIAEVHGPPPTEEPPELIGSSRALALKCAELGFSPAAIGMPCLEKYLTADEIARLPNAPASYPPAAPPDTPSTPSGFVELIPEVDYDPDEDEGPESFEDPEGGCDAERAGD
jgi:hypothetical protein